MKNGAKNRKSPVNGAIPTRAELLAAHDRVLQDMKKMTAKEGFKCLVRAGIVTRGGSTGPPLRQFGAATNLKPAVLSPA